MRRPARYVKRQTIVLLNFVVHVRLPRRHDPCISSLFPLILNYFLHFKFPSELLLYVNVGASWRRATVVTISGHTCRSTYDVMEPTRTLLPAFSKQSKIAVWDIPKTVPAVPIPYRTNVLSQNRGTPKLKNYSHC